MRKGFIEVENDHFAYSLFFPLEVHSTLIYLFLSNLEVAEAGNSLENVYHEFPKYWQLQIFGRVCNWRTFILLLLPITSLFVRVKAHIDLL
jgi:hypothetical protein